MKLIPLLLALAVSTAVNAKTTAFNCETKPVSIPGTNGGPGGRAKSPSNNASIWSVVVEADQSGNVTGVKLNDEPKKFTQKGDLLSFQAAVLNILEINLQTGQAKTSITGYDTSEQGACRVLSVTGATAPSATTTPAIAAPVALSATTVNATPVQTVNKELKVMVVSEIQVTAKYEDYLSKVLASLPAYGGVLIVKGENSAALDGSKSGGSIAIVQFPNRTKAMQWYVSDDYQKILKSTNTVATTRVYSVD